MSRMLGMGGDLFIWNHQMCKEEGKKAQTLNTAPYLVQSVFT